MVHVDMCLRSCVHFKIYWEFLDAVKCVFFKDKLTTKEIQRPNLEALPNLALESQKVDRNS
jgi:hypothetical protein